MGIDIYKRIWELSPYINDANSYDELVDLTQDLISKFVLQGRLLNDPFDFTRVRKLSLPENEIENYLKGSICFVTGGQGLVGSTLINELRRFSVDQIIAIDSKGSPSISENQYSKVIYEQCDIRNNEKLERLFEQYEPDYVFHTAAQRNPGLAEKNIAETVKTNVLGTYNVILACEKTPSVKQCVFSSTGKASRYYTEEVYAATKKVCEYIFDMYAKKSRIKYSFVRFTHILENSLMNEELKSGSVKDSHLKVHSPGKYVTAQNVKEGAYLMLNALAYSKPMQCNFLLVRYLEWPVESLEVALYHIKNAGRKIPVLFMGNPKGYTEKFFRGQLDWSIPYDLNLLINVYENKRRTFNEENDIIISQVCSVESEVIERALENIKKSDGEEDSKYYLLDGLREIVEASLLNVDKNETVNILNWGLQPEYLETEHAEISDYGLMINLLYNSLEGTKQYEKVKDLLVTQ